MGPPSNTGPHPLPHESIPTSLGCLLLMLLGWPRRPTAQITYVSTSAVRVLSSNTVTSLTMTEPPAGGGDVMLRLITENAYPHVGSQRLGSVGVEPRDLRHFGFPRGSSHLQNRYDGGCGTPPSVTFSVHGGGTWGVRSWRSGSLDHQSGVTSNNQLNASSTTRTAPSVTPGTPSTMLLALYTVANGTTGHLVEPVRYDPGMWT